MFLRFAIFIGFILSIGAALGSFSIFSSYQVERELRLDAESKLIQAQESAAVEGETSPEDSARLDELQAMIDDLTSRVEAKAELVNEFESQVKSKDSEISALKQTIEDLRSAVAAVPAVPVKTDLMPKLPDLDEPMTSSLTAEPVEVIAEPVVQSPVENVAAPVMMPEASSTSTSAPSQSSLNESASDFRILTVNRKFNFVVINQGLKDGLRMGDKVEVVQGTAQKALAQVEKIYDKFSAATLLSEDKGNPVHEGDTVRKI